MMTSPSAISRRGNSSPALGGADRKAGKVVIVGLIEPGHFGGLAADQRAARLPAAERDAGDHGGADFRLELAAGEVVEEEQRFGALHHQVVHAHGDQIDADRVVAAGFDGDLDLGADAVIGGDQDRILEAQAALRSNSPPKPPISASAPARAVARTSGLISSTIRLPASISTPACA